MAEPNRERYWRANLVYVAILLSLWFIVSLGAGILFVNWLDQFRLAGFRLGFWFAQQGAIYAFIALIFVYVALMNRLEKRSGLEEKDTTEDPR
jgi:putative solute:sodium symporter small subunit